MISCGIFSEFPFSSTLQDPVSMSEPSAFALGLCGQVLVVGGFCEKLPEISSMSHRVMSVSRLQDGPTLAEAEPNSEGGNASGITDLRKWGKLLLNSSHSENM